MLTNFQRSVMYLIPLPHFKPNFFLGWKQIKGFPPPPPQAQVIFFFPGLLLHYSLQQIVKTSFEKILVQVYATDCCTPATCIKMHGTKCILGKLAHQFFFSTCIHVWEAALMCLPHILNYNFKFSKSTHDHLLILN